jgi:RimJ/RimL family protein N-acetyltransferase
MRPHRLSDFDAMFAMWADPRVVEFITGTPSTREQTWARLLRYIGHWAAMDYGYWALEDRESGEFLGEVGFADYHRIIEPSLDGMPELGWVLAANAHGKGYATEAVRAAIAWGQEHFHRDSRIACIVAPQHQASIRVAEKCGFSLLAHTTYLNAPVLVYRRSLM